MSFLHVNAFCNSTTDSMSIKRLGNLTPSGLRIITIGPPPTNLQSLLLLDIHEMVNFRSHRELGALPHNVAMPVHAVTATWPLD